MEQFMNSTWFAAALTVLGILLGSAVAVNWAHKNGEALGRRVGRWLPGDQVEKWLSEFLDGFQKGLAETYTPVVADVARIDGTQSPDLARFDVRLKPAPGVNFPKSSGA